ncbi:hypothetical protein ASG85_15830 [Paenibacillus sp. Soil724D2]|nr:hypothetical protein ASG85_15830 [Paenibacillus sp. Soil724D2]
MSEFHLHGKMMLQKVQQFCLDATFIPSMLHNVQQFSPIQPIRDKGIRIVVQTATFTCKIAFRRVNCCTNYNIGNHGSPSRLLLESKSEFGARTIKKMTPGEYRIQEPSFY